MLTTILIWDLHGISLNWIKVFFSITSYCAHSHKMCWCMCDYVYSISVPYSVLFLTVSRSSATLFLRLFLVSANCWLSSLSTCEECRKGNWVIMVPHTYIQFAGDYHDCGRYRKCTRHSPCILWIKHLEVDMMPNWHNANLMADLISGSKLYGNDAWNRVSNGISKQKINFVVVNLTNSMLLWIKGGPIKPKTHKKTSHFLKNNEQSPKCTLQYSFLFYKLNTEIQSTN